MTSIVSSEKMKYSGPQSSVSANEESWKGFRLKNSPLKLVVFLGHGSKYSMFIESNRFVNLGMLFLFNTRETVEKPPITKIGGTNKLK